MSDPRLIAKLADARRHIVALLSAVDFLTLPEIYESAPIVEGAARQAIFFLCREGVIERMQRGVYRLKRAKPNHTPFTGSDFIAPIPKHRLMAGRA